MRTDWERHWPEVGSIPALSVDGNALVFVQDSHGSAAKGHDGRPGAPGDRRSTIGSTEAGSPRPAHRKARNGLDEFHSRRTASAGPGNGIRPGAHTHEARGARCTASPIAGSCHQSSWWSRPTCAEVPREIDAAIRTLRIAIAGAMITRPRQTWDLAAHNE